VVSDKPNILIIWGDDIGMSNLSCYSDGVMGYRTRNIDRIADEGVRFTDYYGEQSCTAGRAAFITGQNPYRTGLTKVGLPGATLGLQPQDPTIATALKAQGYATGQFGKNHLGDRDEFLPTMHGFDEFFGNLYHLNAEEEPELPDYPKDPAFREKYGPRGVLHTWANPDGTQRIEDTGPLTKKRMETCDEEFRDAAVDFIRRQHDADTPFFVWFNSTHMHFRTHTKPESIGRAGRWQSPYHDTMLDHDDVVGSLLDVLDDLGIAENTIVMYSTDNGPHMNSWPDGAMTPYRNEKNSNWEGAYRVPAVVRWPARIPAGTVLNGIISHNDWFVTLLSRSCAPERIWAGPPTMSTSTGTTSWLTSPARPTRARANTSSTSTTTAISRRCGSTTGNSCSWSNAAPAPCGSGPSRSLNCVSRSCSTCAPTRMRGPTSRRTPTTTGSWTTSSCSFRPRPTSPRCCRPSPSSRRGRSRPASTWIR
jgi:arylsulfatase A-like enzyme